VDSGLLGCDVLSLAVCPFCLVKDNDFKKIRHSKTTEVQRPEPIHVHYVLFKDASVAYMTRVSVIGE
jgi:hypothetical protein